MNTKLIIILLIVAIVLIELPVIVDASGPGSNKAQQAINIIGYGGRGRIAKWRAIRLTANAERQAKAAGCPCAAVSYRRAKAQFRDGHWAEAYTLLRKGQAQSAYCLRQARVR